MKAADSLEEPKSPRALSKKPRARDRLSGDETGVRQYKLRRANTINNRTQRFNTMNLALVQKNLSDSVKTKMNKETLPGRSLFIFSGDNCLRKLCHNIIKRKSFDNGILVLILISTILLTLENPLDDPKDVKITVLYYLDVVFTSLFVMEFVLKTLANGFLFNGKDSYLRNAWNILDFIIVAFSVISVSFPNINLKFIKVLRILRVLRPLRMISRNEGLKIAVQSLINAIPGIVNVLVICLLFFLLFGILGTNFFKGAFYSCETDSEEDIITKYDCMNVGGIWINS